MNNIQNGTVLKIENMNSGIQSAIVILGTDGHIYLITVTPTAKFCITNEGLLYEKYDENGELLVDKF